MKTDEIMTNRVPFIRIHAVNVISSLGSLIVLFTGRGQG
jgi:hypothetical protein